ncbi:hypothetical protein MXB_3319, partial [Myxobolus squamalis]
AKYALYCFENEIPLPKIEFPIYSLSLQNVVICCTNLNKEERNKLSMIVKYLGGKFSKDLTSAVTHLIAGKVGSKKYFSAKNLSIPVIKSSWTYECWRQSLTHEMVKFDLPMLDVHTCECFFGIVICVTGFSINTREKIKDQIISNGGNYSPELNVHLCHVLLAGSSHSKKKLSAAKRWEIPCVDIKWIDKCLIDNQFYDFEEFLYQNLDISESPVIIEQSTFEANFQHTRFDMSKQDNKIPLDIFQLILFKNFKIFVSNLFEDAKKLGLHAMIEYLGAHISYSIEETSHIVTDWIEDKPLVLPETLVVSSQWIIDCYKLQKYLPEDNYFLFSPNVPIDDYSDQIENNENSAVENIPKFENLQRHLDEIKSLYNKPNPSYSLKSKTDASLYLENAFQRYKWSEKNDHLINITSDFNPSGNILPSQTQLIQYDDPLGKSEREKLMNILQKDSLEDISNINSSHSSHSPTPLQVKQSVVPCQPNTSISVYNPKDIFIQLSSFDDTLKVFFSSLVQKLGGNILECDYYDTRCTHTVVGNIVRSEKLLCSLAAGNWILQQTYLQESEALGHFVSESIHEWGQETTPTKLSLSCARWRKNKSKTGCGAFRNWTVLLFMQSKRSDQYKRVLIAGDAKVFSKKDKLDPDCLITHIIVGIHIFIFILR